MAKRKPVRIDQGHLEFATPRQRAIAEAVLKHGTYAAAAASLGLNGSSVFMSMERLKRSAAKKGYYPEGDATRPTIPGQYLKGISTCYDRNGAISQQWVLQRADRDLMEEIAREIAETLVQDIKPLKLVPAPKVVDTDIMVNYVIADLHLGMYAWAEETGDDYDCQIACDVLGTAMQKLISRMPASETAIISQLGDYIHINDTTNETPKHKNKLDVDTRWSRVVQIGISLYKNAINLALQKHKFVKVFNVAGNHDEHTSLLVGAAIAEAYANNPRVEIVNTAYPYYYHQFGNTLIGLGHGHLAKPSELGAIMLTDMKPVISQCDFFYWLTGHIHHKTSEEFGWYMYETFDTLAAKDAHAAARYRAGRSMTAIVYHKEYGESDRSRVGIREIKEGSSNAEPRSQSIRLTSA